MLILESDPKHDLPTQKRKKINRKWMKKGSEKINCKVSSSPWIFIFKDYLNREEISIQKCLENI